MLRRAMGRRLELGFRWLAKSGSGSILGGLSGSRCVDVTVVMQWLRNYVLLGAVEYRRRLLGEMRKRCYVLVCSTVLLGMVQE